MRQRHASSPGESLRSVAADLNRRDTLSSTGRAWSTTALRQVLASARISGRREHTPTASFNGSARPLIGDIVAVGDWPAIITAEQSDRLRALFTHPARRRTLAEARKTVLSGILRCGNAVPRWCPAHGRVCAALGDYAATADPGSLIDRGDVHPTGLADLAGRRLVVTHETDDGQRLAESTVKRLTGGDPIKARQMRRATGPEQAADALPRFRGLRRADRWRPSSGRSLVRVPLRSGATASGSQ